MPRPWTRRLKRLMVVFFILSMPLSVLGNCENIPVTRGYLDNFRGSFKMPTFATINRNLGLGTHPYLQVLPGALQSPGMRRIVPDPEARAAFVRDARVRIAMTPDYAHIDDKAGVIVVSWWYYHLGDNLDLYLDLLHELTHIRQLKEGKDLWDASRSYADRPTEIEGYAVATEEGRRLGMTEERLQAHLHNPWMTEDDVKRLRASMDALFVAQPLPAQ